MLSEVRAPAETPAAPATGGERARLSVRLAAMALVSSWLGYYVITGMPQMRLEVFVPTVTLHIVTAGAAAFYVGYLVVARRLPGGSPLDWPVVLLLGAYVLATLASVDRRVSLEATLQVLMVALAFYLLSDTRFLRARDVRWGLMLVGAAASLYALWVVGDDYAEWLGLARSVEGGLSLSNLFPPTVPRVHDVSDHPNMLGMTLVLILPFYAVAAYRPGAGWERLAAAAGLLVAAGAIFFSQSRGAWVGAAAGLLLAAGAIAAERAIVGRRRTAAQRPARGRTALAAGAAALLLVVLVGVAGAVAAARWESRPNWLFRSSFSGRQDALEAGAEMFADYPLTGAGPGAYALLYPDYSGEYPVHAIHAHNGFLETGVELGAVGLAAAALLAAAMAWTLWETYRRGSPEQRLAVIACGAALGGFAVHNLADAANLWKAPLFALAAVAAILVRTYRESGDGDGPLGGDGSTPARGAPPPTSDAARFAALLRFAPRVLALLIVPALLIGWARLDSAHFYFDRGVDRAGEGRLLEASSDLERAVDLDPDLAIYQLQLGLSEVMAFQAGAPRILLDEGIGHLRRGVEIDPRSALGYANLARALALAGEEDGARAAALKAQRLAVSDDTVLLAAGEVLEDVGAEREALAAYAAALSRNGALADSPFWTDSEFRRSHYAEIVERSILVFSDCALGTLAASSDGRLPPVGGDLRELAEGCALLVLQNPDNVDQRVALGTILMALGDLDGTFGHLDFAVNRQPDHGPARTALGRWYAARGDLERAREEWLRGSQLDDPQALLLLGDSYPPGQVPDEVVQRLESLLSGSATGPRQHLEGILYYRSRFARGSPLTMLVPGGWQRAVPTAVLEMEEALARWGVRQSPR